MLVRKCSRSLTFHIQGKSDQACNPYAILFGFQPANSWEALRRVFDAHLARQDMRKARLVAAEALRHFREQNNKPAQAGHWTWARHDSFLFLKA
jgi:hypothetical protein